MQTIPIVTRLYKIANSKHEAYKPKKHTNIGYQLVIVMHSPRLVIYANYPHCDVPVQNHQLQAYVLQAENDPKNLNPIPPPPPLNTQKNMTHTDKATDTKSKISMPRQ